MVSLSIENTLAVPTLTVCVISWISSICVLLFACKDRLSLRQQSQTRILKQSADIVVTTIIIVLVICDFCLVTSFSLNIFLKSFLDIPLVCQSIAFASQFFNCFHYLLHMVLSSYLLHILLQTTQYSNYYLYCLHTPKQFILMILLCFTISLFCSITPIFFHGYKKFASFTDKQGHEYGYQCWMVNDWQYILIFLGIFENTFGSYVIILAFIKYCRFYEENFGLNDRISNSKSNN